jgi:hypothetical protein
MIKTNYLILVDLQSVISTGAYQQNLGELRNALTGRYTGGAMYFFNTLSTSFSVIPLFQR